MKNLKIITAVTLIFLLFTSCDKEPKPEIISEETPAPEIIITTEDPLAINADGGEYRLEYKIKNASEDGKISANAGESNWIFDLNCDTDGVVSFIASANENTDERSADITVVYTYNNTKTISASINVVQSAIEINYDFEMEIQDFSGFYYGSDNGINGELNYFLNLSDIGYTEDGYSKPNGTYYQLDVFSDQEPANMEAITLPEGIYTLGAAGKTDAGTFTCDYSNFYITDNEGLTSQKIKFTEGTIEVIKNGDLFRYDIKIVDENGDTHHLTYEGDAVIESGLAEMSSPTTLTEDYVVSFTDETICFAMNFGDMSGLGNNSWLIDIYHSSMTGEEVMLQCFSDISDNVPVGKYTASEDMTSGTFHPGLTDGFNLYSSWYLYAIDGYQGDRYAALVDGSFEIIDNGDGTHTITFDTYDAEYNNITGSWTGEISIDISSVSSPTAIRANKGFVAKNTR